MVPFSILTYVLCWKAAVTLKKNKRDVRILKYWQRKIKDICWVSFSLNRVVMEWYLWYDISILSKYCTHDLRMEMLLLYTWGWSCSSLLDVCDGLWFIDWWSCGNLFSRLFSDRLFSPARSIRWYWSTARTWRWCTSQIPVNFWILASGFCSFTSHFGYLIFASINNISLQMFSTSFFPDKQLA